MDLRLLIVIIGLAVVAYVAWDSFRRRARNQYSFKLEKNIPPDLPIAKGSDREGFDETGVGRTRVIGQVEEHDGHLEPDFDVESPVVVRREPSREPPKQTLDLFAEDVVGSARVSNVEPVKRKSTENKAVRSSANAEMQIITLTVLGRHGRYFTGVELNHCFIEHDLRFGEHKIFHRYADASGQGTVLFSVANALNPGTFDPDRMDQFSTPGISLFMTLPGNFNPQAAYRAMFDLAQMLAKELNGDVLDGQRKPLTDETRAHHQAVLQQFAKPAHV